LQASAQVLSDSRWGCGDGICQFKHQLLIGVEEVALVVKIQVAQLLV